MEHRQHGQDAIRGRHVVHVLRIARIEAQRILREQRALGAPGGAGGIDQQHAALRRRERTGGESGIAVFVGQAGKALAPFARVDQRHAGQRFGAIGAAAVYHRQRRAGVGDDGRQFLVGQTPVERQHDETRARAGEQHRHQFRGVETQPRDARAGRQAALVLQPRSKARAARREFGVTYRVVFEDQRRLGRRACRVMVQPIGESLH
ncbi:MAG: hypothetical protein IPG43_21000 [Proteobacteria bacterium]|nr:hypothetical protein [Pseudomonadota bacterium]